MDPTHGCRISENLSTFLGFMMSSSCFIFPVYHGIQRKVQVLITSQLAMSQTISQKPLPVLSQKVFEATLLK